MFQFRVANFAPTDIWGSTKKELFLRVFYFPDNFQVSIFSIYLGLYLWGIYNIGI